MVAGLPSPRGGQTVENAIVGTAPERARRPVVWFAALGGVILTANFALVAGWIAGPDFKRVPQGPAQLAGGMATTFVVLQILLPVLAVAALYRFLVRPWIRERRVTYDGLICLAGISVSIWDPLSCGVQPWFAYNSSLLNFGNSLSALPGWLSLNQPGRSMAWPFPTVPALYMLLFLALGSMGCAVLHRVKRRFPRLNGIGLVVVALIFMAIFDLIFEGIIFLPLGFWTYGGGWWPVLFGGHYYQFPLNAFLGFCAIGTPIAFLRYYMNDRGESIVEHGVDQVDGGPAKKAGVRLLALVAAAHIMMFAFYHLPQSILALNAHDWPKDVTDRSYFQNQCGELVDRACPGPQIPISKPGSGYVNWAGQYVPSPQG